MTIEIMTFYENYELTPPILEAFAHAGKESAVRLLERRAAKNVDGRLTARNLVEEFTLCFDLFFTRAIRNKPNKLIPPQKGSTKREKMSMKEKRDRLQMAVRGAAALSHMAYEIRHLPDLQKRAAVSLLRNGKKDFYHHYSTRSLHPGVIKWFEVVLNETLSVEERAQRRPELIGALHATFAKAGQISSQTKEIAPLDPITAIPGLIASVHPQAKPGMT